MPAESYDAVKTRLLVVDDDKKLCRLIKDYLEALGYDVVTVHTARQGLEKALAETFDAVILSVPAMDNHTRAHEPRSARLCAADDRHFMFALSAYPTVGSLSLARYGCS